MQGDAIIANSRIAYGDAALTLDFNIHYIGPLHT